jgi:hypothetical protein
MADNSPISGPTVRLELRNGNGRPTIYHVAGSEFLIGSVAGCDLKLSGANLPALVCVLTRQANGVFVRKLATTLPLLHNGEPFMAKKLATGDLLSLGPMTILAAIESAAPAIRPTEVRFEPIPIPATPTPKKAAHEELAAERRELSKQYQQRRDRLAGLQQAVDTAARNLQQQKRLVEVERKNVGQIQQSVEARRAEVEKRERYVTDAQEKLARAKLALDEEIQQLDDRKADLADRESKLAQREEQHRDDLARLDRLQGTLEQRERQLETRLSDCERRAEQIQITEQSFAERERNIDSTLAQQREQAEQLYRIQIELDERRERLDERIRVVESQQSILATMRTQMERTRDEVRKEAALLVEQRACQEAAERSLQEQLRQASAAQSSLTVEHQSHAEARRQFDERNAALQVAAEQLRQLQDTLKQEADAQQRRAGELDAQAAQLADLERQLENDRQALDERGSNDGQSDETRRALQEQLQRRSDDLAAKEKQLEDRATAQAEAMAEFEHVQAAFQQVRTEVESQLAAARTEMDGQSAEINRRIAELDEREETLRRHVERLRTVGSALAAERKAQHTERTRWTAEQQALLAEVDALRTELEAYRSRTAQESAQLHQQLPDLELRGEAVLARITQAREELHGHLAELHEYVRQSQNDLQALRTHLQSEFDRLRAQELAVQRERTEHRLSVTAFRQNLVEWQARIADMKRSLTHDGTRLEWKRTEVDAAAREIDAASQQLAQQAAELVVQEQQVQARRAEMERHLEDLREWYRQKLRELAESGSASRSLNRDFEEPKSLSLPGALESAEPGTRHPMPDSPAVLSLQDELDPGDRQLGALLKTLQLVDDETLTALWLDARRQRRSLRQVLLAGREQGAPLLTLYQMALIESGNLDSLVLGRLRVVDRLQVLPRETVYRVFDPYRGSMCLLRHLAESEASDSDRADDFRRCFAAAKTLDHANVAATYETLDINGRPAVLQEWLTGLPSSDWPAAVGTPGVWFRLMMQCALGMRAVHEANLVCGQLSLRSVLLTSVGVVKLVGAGDPPWIHGIEEGRTALDELHSLGQLAADWAARAPRRRGNKLPKPLPAALVDVLNRLQPDAADAFASASELLVALEAAGDQLPDASDAWDALLEHVAETNAERVAMRKSA